MTMKFPLKEGDYLFYIKYRTQRDDLPKGFYVIDYLYWDEDKAVLECYGTDQVVEWWELPALKEDTLLPTCLKRGYLTL